MPEFSKKQLSVTAYRMRADWQHAPRCPEWVTKNVDQFRLFPALASQSEVVALLYDGSHIFRVRDGDYLVLNPLGDCSLENQENFEHAGSGLEDCE